VPLRARTGRRATYGSDALCLGAALVPVLGSATWKAFVRPRPFWAQFYDPETFYFHDGLRLLDGQPPLDFTHPGTPVQALTALVALATGATSAMPELLDRFRAAAYILAWALQLVGAFVLLRTVLARLPIPARIAALLTYFLAATSLEYQTVWSPELLFFPAGAIALAAAWRALGRGFDFGSSLLAGAAVGLACAVKFLFLPWLIAAGLTAVSAARGSWGRRLSAASAVALGAALAFVAATLPAATRYPDMASWVARLASRSGSYAESPQTIPALSTLLSNLWTLVAGATGWYVWLSLAATGAWLAVREAGRGDEGRRLRGLALFTATAIILLHLIVLRAPSGHYLLTSAIATVGLVAVAGHAPQLRIAGLRWALLLLAGMLLGKHMLSDTRTHLARNQTAERWRTALVAAVARHAPAARAPVVVYGYSTPIPSLALRYFATDPDLLRRVEALYPGEGHLGPGDRLFLPAGASAWDVMVLDPRDRQRYAGAASATVVDHVGAWEILVPGDSRYRGGPS
jgi:hypothetical protein